MKWLRDHQLQEEKGLLAVAPADDGRGGGSNSINVRDDQYLAQMYNNLQKFTKSCFSVWKFP